ETDPVPLTMLRADVPSGLEAVVHRCLQKDPARRYQNVGELAIDLLPFGPKRARMAGWGAPPILCAAGMGQTELKGPSAHIPPPDGTYSGPVVATVPNKPPRSKAPLVAIALGLALTAGFIGYRASRSASATTSPAPAPALQPQNAQAPEAAPPTPPIATAPP